MSARPPFSIITASAPSIADFTDPGYLSPKMRISGPVIGITCGLIAAVVVDITASLKPSAASSRTSEFFPTKTPCRYTCTTGARPLGRHRPGMSRSLTPVPRFLRRIFSRAVSTAPRTSRRYRAWSSFATTPVTTPSAVHAASTTSSSSSMSSSNRPLMSCGTSSSSSKHGASTAKTPQSFAAAARTRGDSSSNPLTTSGRSK